MHYGKPSLYRQSSSSNFLYNRGSYLIFSKLSDFILKLPPPSLHLGEGGRPNPYREKVQRELDEFPRRSTETVLELVLVALVFQFVWHVAHPFGWWVREVVATLTGPLLT